MEILAAFLVFHVLPNYHSCSITRWKHDTCFLFLKLMEVSKILIGKKRERGNFGRIKFGLLSFASKMSASTYKPVTLNELSFSRLPYYKHLINRALVGLYGIILTLVVRVQTPLRSVRTHDLGRYSPIQTKRSLTRCSTVNLKLPIMKVVGIG